MGWQGANDRYQPSLTFDVPASRAQAEKWEAAAAAEGHRVEAWLAHAADFYLKELMRTGRQPSLYWYKELFRVLLADGEWRVRGIISGPFGIFRGDRRGLGEPGSGRHSLVHLPTQRILETLPLRKSCMALAAELSRLRVNWRETDPQKVLLGAPDQEKAVKLIRLFDRLLSER